MVDAVQLGPEPVAQEELRVRLEKHIKLGVGAALTSCLFTNVFALTGFAGFNVLYLLDGELLLAMAWGVQRKSRIAATLLTGYFLASKIVLLLRDPVQFSPGLLGLGFLYLFGQAMVATYRWHRLQRAPAHEAVPQPVCGDASASSTGDWIDRLPPVQPRQSVPSLTRL